MTPCFLNVFVLSVARARHNHGLIYTLSFMIPSDLVRGLIPIHERHLAVHENEAIGVVTALHTMPHLVKGILSIISLINNIFNLRDAALLENDLHSERVKWLVVDNEYSLL